MRYSEFPNSAANHWSGLIKPELGRVFTDGAVSRYALTAEGWCQLRDFAPVGRVNPVSA